MERDRMDLKIRKSTNIWNHYKEVYEWNPGNGRWYHIHGNNIEFDAERETRTLQQNLFNALYLGIVAIVNGSYNQAAKKLTLKL